MSVVVKAINKFLDTDANISALVKRIALGPQEEVVNRIDVMNNRFGTSFRCTPSFRWQPGFYKQLNIEATRISGYSSQKRKVSTYKNNIRNSEWQVKNFFDSVVRIDTDLYNLRSNNTLFQDNTDNVELCLGDYKNKIVSTIDKAHEMYPNMTIIPYLGSHEQYQRERRTSANRLVGTITTVNFYVKLENTVMNVRIGDTNADINVGTIEVIFTVDLIKNLMNRIRMHANGRNFEEHSLTINSGLHMGHTSNQHGGKYTPLIPRTVFPYISSREGWNPDMRVEMITDNGQLDPNGYSNICFGSYADVISESFWKGDMMALAINLDQWSRIFRIGHTNPLNGFERLFHGVPIEFNQEEFRNSGRLPSDNGNQCYITHHMEIEEIIQETEEESLCAQSKCILREVCDTYQNAYHPEPSSDMILEAEMVNDSNLSEAELLRMYEGIRTVNPQNPF